MRRFRWPRRLALPLNHLPVITRGGPLGPPRTLQVLARAPHRYARDPLRVEVTVSFACFACGDTGHIKADCPELHRPTTTAEPPSSSTPAPGGANYAAIEELRRVVPVEVTAELAERHGSQTRAAMGWGREERGKELRALALAQAEESRRERLAREALDEAPAAELDAMRDHAYSGSVPGPWRKNVDGQL